MVFDEMKTLEYRGLLERRGSTLSLESVIDAAIDKVLNRMTKPEKEFVELATILPFERTATAGPASR